MLSAGLASQSRTTRLARVPTTALTPTMSAEREALPSSAERGDPEVSLLLALALALTLTLTLTLTLALTLTPTLTLTRWASACRVSTKGRSAASTGSAAW